MDLCEPVPRAQTILKFRDFKDFIDNCYEPTFAKPKLPTGAIKVAHEYYIGYISNPDTVKELEKIEYITVEKSDNRYAKEFEGYYGKVDLKPKKWFKEFSKCRNLYI